MVSFTRYRNKRILTGRRTDKIVILLGLRFFRSKVQNLKNELQSNPVHATTLI